jgi:hypothetical protein
VQVLVDTNIWSLALRRHKSHLNESETELVAVLRDLTQSGRARIIGPFRQELLSGIREPAQFERVRDGLRSFPYELLTQVITNKRDADFRVYAKTVPIHFHPARV